MISGTRLLVALLLLVISSAAGPAQERFPAKPIEMIIPTAPGGGADSSLRLLAELAEPDLGHKIVVINKPGASGSLGVTQLVGAKPDGYTLGGLWFAPLTIVPHMMPVTYSLSDYEAVSLAVVVPLIYCVHADFPAKNATEFLDHLKASPAKYTYGTDGVGGASHLASERIFRKRGIEARAIPFTDSGQILKNFLGKHIDIYIGVIGPIAPHTKTSGVRCLLLTTPERSPAMPGAASLTDVGLASEATLVWRGIIAPKGTPADRIKVLDAAFAKAAKHERFKAFIEAQGGSAIGGSASEFAALIAREHEAFGGIVKALGIGKK